ncbi:MAG: HPr family phosphocarrier protein [Ruminococcaceae bacterium]|nr:HPr family phosphocarrier protein [Oscillospiraceae bacterium]
MTNVKVKLASIQDVRNFVDTVTKFNIDIDLSSGRYVVDAKSIMGIFSLDLLNPINLTALTDDADEEKALLEALKPFIVE